MSHTAVQPWAEPARSRASAPRRSHVLQSCAAGSSEPGPMPAPSQGTPHAGEPRSGLLPGKHSGTGQHALPRTPCAPASDPRPVHDVLPKPDLCNIPDAHGVDISSLPPIRSPWKCSPATPHHLLKETQTKAMSVKLSMLRQGTRRLP